MAKIAVIADTHWGVRNDSSVFYDYFKRSLEGFYKEIRDQNIQHVIHVGDLFDRRKYLNYLTAKRCREDFLEVINSMGVETHIIAGNHDIYYKNTLEVNCLDEIIGDRYPNIHTYINPKEITIDGFDILLLPWITESNSKESFDLIATTKASHVFGHLEMQGFEYLKGIISTEGQDSHVFSRFDGVFTGHYHHRSSVGNIHYIGALAEYTWSDHNDPRGFSIFDTSTREMEFYQNPISLFKMIGYDDEANPEMFKVDLSHLADSYVKVVVQNKDPYLFDLFIEELYKVSPINITIIEDMSVFTDDEEFEGIDQAESTSVILDKYISGLTLPVDTDRLKTFMRGIHNEAIALGSEL